jgi:hypothetical protein
LINEEKEIKLILGSSIKNNKKEDKEEENQ